MNKLCLIAAILLFAVCIPAQPPKPPEENKKESKEVAKTEKIAQAVKRSRSCNYRNKKVQDSPAARKSKSRNYSQNRNRKCDNN